VVTQLERLDAAVVDPSGVVRIRDDGLQSGMTALAVRVVDEQERARRLAASRVEMLRGYAETTGCRRRFLLNYLGEEYEPPCGACDRCLATSETPGGGTPRPDDRIDRGTGSFRLNDPVVHARFGPGLVSRVEGDRITVRFEDVGYRTLSLPEVEGRGVLVRADVDPSVDDP
jgi:ATP-dependent DNA helicase RecQ